MSIFQKFSLFILGILPNYSNCGLKSELDDDKLKILEEIITNDDKGYTIEDVRQLIYELFGIKFSYSNVWFIKRKKTWIKLQKTFY